MSARTGQIFKARSGKWAIRFRDGQGNRHQRNGYANKAEAKKALDEALRRARLGPLHRPDATLRELGDAFLEQYTAAPSSIEWVRYNLSKALPWFEDRPIGSIAPEEIARWRASLPEGRKHPAHRALRQVLQQAVRWKWIEENPALLVPNPAAKRPEIHPFESWDEIDAVAAELGPFGPLVVFMAGTGVRPEEAFGAEWRDISLTEGVAVVRRSFAKGRLKDYAKTTDSRRRVPLRARVIDALEELPRREGILFPAERGGRINIDAWRRREWAPALKAAGIPHRRIYDLRHTYATWSLAAGIGIFTLARRMGTSVKMIDETYGHLAFNADEQERGLLNAFDTAFSTAGRSVGATRLSGADPKIPHLQR